MAASDARDLRVTVMVTCENSEQPSPRISENGDNTYLEEHIAKPSADTCQRVSHDPHCHDVPAVQKVVLNRRLSDF